jgi:hypothetical protein
MDTESRTTMIRNIVSTNTAIDIDPEVSEQIKEIIDAIQCPVRETYGLDEIGQRIYQSRVVEYIDPQIGQTRWAWTYVDQASPEYEDYDTQAEAEARYEEIIGDQIRQGVTFDATDVWVDEVLS